MREIQTISADSGDHLQEVENNVVSVALSYAVFGRVDWAIMLSCFVCLWMEVLDRFVDGGAWKLNDLLDVLRSGTLASIVAAYTTEHGFAPHPYVLFEIFLRPDKGPPSKKRAANNGVSWQKSKKCEQSQ